MEGDQMKMREALEFIKLASDDYEKYGNTKAGALDVINEKACAALSLPRRNCDVGTADEQIKRWEKFCQEHHEYWKPSKSLTAIQRCNCPCHEGNGCNYFVWAQMPYEAEEGAGK